EHPAFAERFACARSPTFCGFHRRTQSLLRNSSSADHKQNVHSLRRGSAPNAPSELRSEIRCGIAGVFFRPARIPSRNNAAPAGQILAWRFSLSPPPEENSPNHNPRVEPMNRLPILPLPEGEGRGEGEGAGRG